MANKDRKKEKLNKPKLSAAEKKAKKDRKQAAKTSR